MTDEDISQGGLEIHGIRLNVVNISATYSLDRELDLKALSQDLEDSEFNPERYPSLILRVPEATFLIPRSGKVTLVGADNKERIEGIFRTLINELQALGITCDFDPTQIHVQNIVVQGQFERSLELSSLAVELGFERNEYEPEQFPGLVYRDQEGVVLFFSSGKFIITGVSRFSQVEDVANRVYSKLRSMGVKID